MTLKNCSVCKYEVPAVAVRAGMCVDCLLATAQNRADDLNALRSRVELLEKEVARLQDAAHTHGT